VQHGHDANCGEKLLTRALIHCSVEGCIFVQVNKNLAPMAAHLRRNQNATEVIPDQYVANGFDLCPSGCMLVANALRADDDDELESEHSEGLKSMCADFLDYLPSQVSTSTRN
jgi:hypothetical protein